MSLYTLFSQMHHALRPPINASINGNAHRKFICVSKIIVSMNRGWVSGNVYNKSSFKELFASFASKFNDKLSLFGEILTLQCHFYAAQRMRRLLQISSLYKTLYNERSLQHMVSRFAKRLQKKKNLGFVLGAVLFNWQQETISTEEMNNCVEEFDRMVAPTGLNYRNDNGMLNASEKLWDVQQLNSSGWEPVIAKPNLQVWRKSVPKSYLYEYKVFGSFHDIPARAFFSVQTDTEYRKKWDKLVIKLDVIDKDEHDKCEVVHWVMHYPYPMYSRDYVYIRRAMVDQKNLVMVLVSRSTNHPACPTEKKYVRVQKYFSQMVIRPHRNFDDTGFDYILTYFDDPEAAFPSPAYNWMASTGVPDFVGKLHNAARQLYLQNRTTVNLSPEISQNCGFHPVYS